MTIALFLGTNRGVVNGRLDGHEEQLLDRSLTDHKVTSVTLQHNILLSGTTEGIYRSINGGRDWMEANDGLTIGHIRWLATHPDVPGFILAGTEPAGLFVSQNGGESWAERSEVATLRDQFDWFLPYSPEAGCVRGFAFHGPRCYAAVEVGGLLRSDDSGKNWRLAEGSDGRPVFGSPRKGFVHPDVHSIVVHPALPEQIYAPTGGGFFVSVDGGRIWEQRYPACYCRATWADPADPNHIILGPADSVDRNGRIEETLDGGESWHLITDGLDTPWPHHMVERFHQHGSQLFALLSNGQLFVAEAGDWRWQRIFTGIGVVHCLATFDLVDRD